MKQGQKGIAWVAEHHAPESFLCTSPDNKGAIATIVCEAIAKKRRIFRYYGYKLPRKVIRELGKQYPGLLIEAYEGEAPNADIAYCDNEEEYQKIWHNTVVLVFSDFQPPGAAKACQYPGEPPLWVTPPHMLPQKSFQVKTRNCVEDDEIKANVHHSLSLGLPMLPRFAVHGETAVVCSAGPSIVNHVDEIRDWTQKEQARVVCVKHSHDLFLDAGIIPWACVLLDPRAHVKDFIDRPHPAVKYFVSTTCHPTTFDRLLSRGADIWTYHALVGGGEEDLVKMHMAATQRERQRLGGPDKPFESADMMVAGGTTAASRGISLLHMMGFRRFTLYGFDSCYWEPKDMSEKANDGNPKYHHLTVGGKKFFTDAELVAQVQDFKHLQQVMTDVTFDVRGDGMVPRVMEAGWRGFPQLDEVFPPSSFDVPANI